MVVRLENPQFDRLLQTALGLLPAEWNVVTVRDKYSFTQKPRGLRYDSFESIPFVPMELIPFHKIAFHDYLLKKPAEFSSGTYFEAGDILLPKITPSFENGKQGIISELPNGFGVATTEVIPLKGIDGVSDTGFLFYYLLKDDVRVSLAGKMEGSTGRQRLSKAVVESLLVPFPPLPEQRAIARVLATIQHAIDAQDKLIAAARELKKSLMRQLFTQGFDANGAVKETEIGVMPEHWELYPMREVVEIQYGYQTSIPKVPPKNGIEIISTAEILNEGRLSLSKIRTVEIPTHRIEKYRVHRHDVLFNWRNAQEHVGKTAIVEEEPIAPTIFASFILRLRSLGNLDQRYLHFVLTHLRQIGTFFVLSRRAVNQANFNANELGELQIGVPPLPEQREIARILVTADKKIETEEKRKAALQALFKTMLQQLMTGKIRIVDSVV